MSNAIRDGVIVPTSALSGAALVASRKRDVDAEWRTRRNAGFLYSGFQISTDDEGRADLMAGRRVFDDDPTFVYETVLRGTRITLTKGVFDVIWATAQARELACGQRRAALYDALDAAADDAAVNAIDITTGWP